ncbi:MAG TPA: hypothetical protein EYO33_24615 [Phycisphaerales bacterium]|nr:hypothetical protein [Phycisphaerales bacterium]
MLDAKETCKIKSGFHLDEDTVVVSRRMPDGRWEAWIEKENAVLIAPNGEPAPNFYDSTRFRAQCKASNWYQEQVFAE